MRERKERDNEIAKENWKNAGCQKFLYFEPDLVITAAVKCPTFQSVVASDTILISPTVLFSHWGTADTWIASGNVKMFICAFFRLSCFRLLTPIHCFWKVAVDCSVSPHYGAHRIKNMFHRFLFSRRAWAALYKKRFLFKIGTLWRVYKRKRHKELISSFFQSMLAWTLSFHKPCHDMYKR